MKLLVLIQTLLYFSYIVWNDSLPLYPSPKQFHLVFRKHIQKSFKICSTAWKVSKYGDFSSPYFPAFRERYLSLRIQFECGKIRTTKNSVFGHFSRSVESYDNITLIGDLDITPEDKNLQHFTDTFSHEHPINEPTCSQRKSKLHWSYYHQ